MISFSPLPAPAWRSDTPGCSARTAATARSSGATWSPASAGSPRSRATTSAVRPPSAESSGASAGPVAPATSGRAASRCGHGGRGGARRGGVAGADEHLLGGRILQAGGLDQLVGARGLAGPALGEADRAWCRSSRPSRCSRRRAGARGRWWSWGAGSRRGRGLGVACPSRSRRGRRASLGRGGVSSAARPRTGVGVIPRQSGTATPGRHQGPREAACTVVPGSRRSRAPSRSSRERPPLRRARRTARSSRCCSELIRIDTSNPPGNEAQVAELLRARLAPLGFQVEIVPTPGAGQGAPDRAAARDRAGDGEADPARGPRRRRRGRAPAVDRRPVRRADPGRPHLRPRRDGLQGRPGRVHGRRRADRARGDAAHPRPDPALRGRRGGRRLRHDLARREPLGQDRRRRLDQRGRLDLPGRLGRRAAHGHHDDRQELALGHVPHPRHLDPLLAAAARQRAAPPGAGAQPRRELRHRAADHAGRADLPAARGRRCRPGRTARRLRHAAAHAPRRRAPARRRPAARRPLRRAVRRAGAQHLRADDRRRRLPGQRAARAPPRRR